MICLYINQTNGRVLCAQILVSQNKMSNWVKEIVDAKFKSYIHYWPITDVDRKALERFGYRVEMKQLYDRCQCSAPEPCPAKPQVYYEINKG